MIVISVRRTQPLVMRDREIMLLDGKDLRYNIKWKQKMEAIVRTTLLQSYGKCMGKMTGGH